MKRFPCFLVLVVGLLSSLWLRADDPDTAFALPSGGPQAVLLLPDGTGQQKIGIAVSQGLAADDWDHLNWDHNVTIATTSQSHIDMKVYAVAGASDVKLYLSYTATRSMSEDRIKRTVAKKLRSLEEAIAKKLNLEFHEGDGKDKPDSATPR